MSTSSIRARVSKNLLKNVNTTSEKLVSEAARIVLQSKQASQCLVLNRKAVRSLQTGFEAGIGRPLTQKEGTKYRKNVKKFFVESSMPFPNFIGKTYFLEILRKNNLALGRNIFYLGVSFNTIKQRYHSFNTDFLEKLKDDKLSYNRDAPGKVTQFDHGADGTNVASLGGAAQAFQLGVEMGYSESELLKKAGDNLAYIINDTFTALSKNEKSKLKATLYDILINWKQVVRKNGSLNAGVGVIVTPVPSPENIGRSSLEKKEFNALLDAVESAITDVPWVDIKGSSTLRQKAEKAIVFSFVEQLSGSNVKINIAPSIKNAKLKTKNKVRDRSKSSKSFKPGSFKKASGARRAEQPSAKPRIRVQAGRAGAPSGVSIQMYLLALLNKDLPRVVAKNMQSPALNYRTGRFASSVRVTDVVITPKGFPSVGYTYDKSRYQTFEPSFAQGSVERDPRKLIDRSIREIAAKYAIGRFFTRRV